jgi:hypothetical protein
MGGNPISTHPLVNEYPKSGGSWLAQMLAEALELPFPRNRLPLLRSSILHGHYRAKHPRIPTTMVWRDGRDVMVSLYFHRLGENSFASSAARLAARKALGIGDPANIELYLPRFIELVSNGGTHPWLDWGAFVENWKNHPRLVAEVKYEDMLHDSAEAITQVAAAYGRPLSQTRAEEIANRFSFRSQAKRAPGQEDPSSYLRKGVAGDWRNKFSIEAREVFDHHMGHGLVTLGYEPNNRWVERNDC